jgi:hypothetical protein
VQQLKRAYAWSILQLTAPYFLEVHIEKSLVQSTNNPLLSNTYAVGCFAQKAKMQL